MCKYENFISLGYFCSVAEELDRIGLRSTSSPFDWCISDFEGVMAAIQNGFDGFLDYNQLYQSTTERGHYFNSKYGIWFYHDFDKYHTLREQLDCVTAKYQRRIDRFYKNISRPTLFIRYISNEVLNQDGKSAELSYIENNYYFIKDILKSFNINNEIIFIANSEVPPSIIDIYRLEKDENDNVARKFLDKSDDILNFFMSLDYEERAANLNFFEKKLARKRRVISKVTDMFYCFFQEHIMEVYIHDKQVSPQTMRRGYQELSD